MLARARRARLRALIYALCREAGVSHCTLSDEFSGRIGRQEAGTELAAEVSEPSASSSVLPAAASTAGGLTLWDRRGPNFTMQPKVKFTYECAEIRQWER